MQASPAPLSDSLFRDLDPRTVRSLVMAAADVALVVDKRGVVRDLAFRDDDLRGALGDAGDWLGRPWRTAMTVESRPKLDAMLQDALSERPIRWRQLNHPAQEGIDVAISYSAVPVARDESVILLGRDLRSTAALQQRLIETQHSLERDYLALRRTEARYRTLFETARDGIAVIDAQTLRPVELNPAARLLLGADAKRAAGRSFADCFAPAHRAAVAEALQAARIGLAARPVRAAAANGVVLEMSLSSLREEEGWFLLARFAGDEPAAAPDPAAAGEPPLPPLLALMPDAMALCDAEGDIVAANEAFRSLVGLAPAQTVAGEPLGRWLGRDGVDLSVLIANLRQRGAVRLFASSVRSEQGIDTQVEISAIVRPDGRDGFAFYLRDVGRRPASDRPRVAAAARPGAAAPVSPGQDGGAGGVGALIGRVPLKQLVRESTDAIERLCIESALEMTGNNRASAAEMLGVSRQSLYVKLRRYGLVDPDDRSAP